MELSEGRRLHNQLICELKNVLVKCGIPEKVIAVEVVLRSQNGRRQDADILVLGEDNKTIVSQFEVTLGPDGYRNAIRSLRDMPQHPKCYVVTRINNEVVMSAINKDKRPNWVLLSDLNAIAQMLGNYTTEADLVVSSAEEKKQQIASKEWNWFRWVVGAVGMILVGTTGALEWNGHEFSWKVYFLLFIIMAIFAAASGYVVHVKIGENEFAIKKKTN